METYCPLSAGVDALITTGVVESAAYIIMVYTSKLNIVKIFFM